MLSKIKKANTEKLEKYLIVIDQCFTFSLISLVVSLIIFGIPSIVKSVEGIEVNAIIPIFAALLFLILSSILDGISKQIKQELSHRKEEEIIEILSTFGPKKIKFNDPENIDFKKLLEDSEIQADYDDENDIVYVTFLITGDDGCSKISKKIKFEKDEILSEIKII